MSIRKPFQFERLEERMVLSANTPTERLHDLRPLEHLESAAEGLREFSEALLGHIRLPGETPPSFVDPRDLPIPADDPHPLFLQWLQSHEDGLHVFRFQAPPDHIADPSRLVLMLQGAADQQWRPQVQMISSLGDTIFGRAVDNRDGLVVFEFNGLDPYLQYQVAIDQRGIVEEARVCDFLISVHLGTTWQCLREAIASQSLDLTQAQMLLVTEGNSFSVLLSSWSESSDTSGRVRFSIVSSKGEEVFEDESAVGSTYSDDVTLVEGEYYLFIESYDESGFLRPGTTHQLTMAVIEEPVGPLLSDAVPNIEVPNDLASPGPLAVGPMILSSMKAIDLDDAVALPEWASLVEIAPESRLAANTAANIGPTVRGVKTHATTGAVDAAFSAVEARGADVLMSAATAALPWFSIQMEGMLLATVPGKMNSPAGSHPAIHPLVALTENKTLKEDKSSETAVVELPVADPPVAEVSVSNRPTHVRTALGLALSGVLLLRPAALVPSSLRKRWRKGH